MTYLLNLIDLAFTLHALSHGAWEVNPLMRNVPFMVVYKVFGVGLLCWMLQLFAKDIRVPTKTRSMCRGGLRVCTAWFAVACLWHIVNLFAVKVI